MNLAQAYWAQGFDIVTGTNCKLMNASFNESDRLPGNDFASMQLKERILVPWTKTWTLCAYAAEQYCMPERHLSESDKQFYCGF